MEALIVFVQSQRENSKLLLITVVKIARRDTEIAGPMPIFTLPILKTKSSCHKQDTQCGGLEYYESVKVFTQ